MHDEQDKAQDKATAKRDKIEAYSKGAVLVGGIGFIVIATLVSADPPKAWSTSWYLTAALLIVSTVIAGLCGWLACWLGKTGSKNYASLANDHVNLVNEMSALRKDLAAREREWLRRDTKLVDALEEITQQLAAMTVTLAAVEKRQTDGYLCAYVDGMSGREPAVKRGALHLVPQSPFDQD